MRPLFRRTASPTTALPDRLQADPVDILNHELRSPLTAVLGHAELLQDLDLPDSAACSLEAIIRAGERLLSLADALARVVDLERAAYDTAPRGAELAALVRHAGSGTSYA